MAKKKTKEDYGKAALELGLGIGGGIAGNFATSMLEKQAFMGKAAPYSSAIVALLGAVGYVLLPEKATELKAFAFGMAVIGGTEQGEVLLAKTGVMQGLGFSQEQLGLGFTGKALPEDTSSVFYTKNGVAVR